MTEPPMAPDLNPNFCMEFDCLPIPPLDPLFLSASNLTSTQSLTSDLGFSLDDNGDFELNFDDLDDLYFPLENESFLIPTSTQAGSLPVDLISQSIEGYSGNFTPDSAITGDRGSDVVDKYLNCWSSESGSCNRESSQDSGDGCSNAARSLNFPSPVSSHGSGVSEAVNAPLPDSCNLVVDQKVEVEETGKSSVPKRKKEDEDTNDEYRTSKYHKSSMPSENADGVSIATNEDEDKRMARLMRNRESAQLSRQRKKHYVEELEDKVKAMHSTIADLNGKISYFMAENATLRQQLSGGAGMCPPPPPGMYPPMAPIPYPWMCSPYVVKPQGSQVPLIPIPRLKPQKPLPAPKAKKSENKKSEPTIKKVASISFLGLMFFILLFGGLVPLVNVKYRGISDSVHGGCNYLTDRFNDQHRGRVLKVNGHSNLSGGSMGIGFSGGDFDVSNRIHCERCRAGGSGYDADQKERGGASNVPCSVDNASEPLVASLFVPRNDKLVKIDGNLIIHSVLASEKAMASRKSPERKNDRETGLAIPRVSPALAIPDIRRSGGMSSHLFRSTNERQKALSSGSADTLKDHFKSSVADGKLQQWFREGVAGPMLSSGMCTEVFQFDASPASAAGVIIPAPSVANISVEHRQNATHLKKGRERRILRGLHVPLTGSDLNITADHVGKKFQKEDFQGNKSASSTVVSVLVDPREVGDADIDGVIAPKSLSRIFVVVLLDSVKYVTYSCVLPRSSPHLVTT